MTRFASSSGLLLLIPACMQNAPRTGPELTQQLGASSVNERVEAADALAKLGSRAAPAVPRLIKALDDEEVRVKRSAATALGMIGPAALPAFPALVQLKGMAQAEAALCAIAATVKPAAFVDALWRHTASQGDMATKVTAILAMRSMAARCPKIAATLHPLIKRRARQELDKVTRENKPPLTGVQAQAPTVRIERIGAGDRGAVTLDGVMVGTLKQLRDNDSPTWKLPKLVQLLEAKKATWERANPGKAFAGELVLMVEKAIDFKLVKKVIYSCGQAGYSKVQFSVAPTSEPT
jgi:hypothetical protein